jgi:hypothetical protein
VEGEALGSEDEDSHAAIQGVQGSCEGDQAWT